MTAIRDRRDETEPDDASVPWNLRLIVVERRGIPWWGAVILAFGLSLLGALATFRSNNASPGFVFVVCYFLGCVGAICLVQRRSLFTPMVQPPLIIGVAVPGVVLFASTAPAGDGLSKVLSIGNPLINSFPLMAITTAVTVAVGALRLFRERDPEAATKRVGSGKNPRNSGSSPSRKNLTAKAEGSKSPSRRVPGESSRPAIPARGRSTDTGERPRPSERRKATPSGSGSSRGTGTADERRREPGGSTSGRFRPPPADPRSSTRQGEPRPQRRQPPPVRRPWNDDD